MENISFEVPCAPTETIDFENCDIRKFAEEILAKKFDTDSSEEDESPTYSPKRPRSWNDSGVELAESCSENPVSARRVSKGKSRLLAKLAADSVHHNTNRFTSHDSYDSEDSDQSEQALRAVHNRHNPGSRNWYKASSGCLRRQYEEIRTSKQSGSFAFSRARPNQVRNRYSDVPCYDHTRVRLEDSRLSDENDYINASYCDGFEMKKKYICTQGPKENTIPHFWQMVWESNSRVIVMTTKLFENEKKKCDLYWPLEGERKIAGAFLLTNLGQTLEEEHFTRTTIEIEFECQTRTIFHFAFRKWPDFDVPECPEMLLDFQDHVNECHATIRSQLISPYGPPTPSDEDAFEISPIVVHCSAGIGRTGTYLGIDICRAWLEVDVEIDLFATIKRIRDQRAFSVQTHAQYQFCLSALIDILKRKLRALEEPENEEMEQSDEE